MQNKTKNSMGNFNINNEIGSLKNISECHMSIVIDACDRKSDYLKGVLTNFYY